MDHDPDPDDASSDLDDSLRDFVAQVGQEAARDALLKLDVGRAGSDLPLGSVLGDYTLVRHIGSGGMGTVFEATQGSIPGRRVAVKLLLNTGAAALRLSRFAREVEVIGRLDHPNIVQIVSADLDGPIPYYALALVDGPSLGEALDDGSWSPSDFGRIAGMARDLALALQHAHERGVVHRDVTPRNIMIAKDGRPMLLDFGLAHDELATVDLTLTVDAIGTPDFMAPEQISKKLGPISAATDIYALGVTMYRCLTGKAPYHRGSRHATFVNILRGAPKPLRKLNVAVPRDLQSICLKAMAYRSTNRYASASEFANDLQAFLDYTPIQASAIGVLTRTRNWARAHRQLAIAVTAASLALVIPLSYWGWFRPLSIVQAMDREFHAGDLTAAEQHAMRVKTGFPQSRFARSASHRLVEIAQVRADEQLGEFARMEQQRTGIQAAARRSFDDSRALLDRPPQRVARGEVSSVERDLKMYEKALEGIDRRVAEVLANCLALSPTHPGVRAAHLQLHARQLRTCLEDLGALHDPVTLAALEDALRRFCDEHELLDRTGEINISCASGEAQIWLCESTLTVDGRSTYVDPGQAGSRLLGSTPIRAMSVDEGSYLIRATVDGFAEIELPWLIRRRAVQSKGEQTLALEPRSEEEIGEIFRYVHAGYSVIGPRRASPVDFAPRLTWIDGFFMTEREVTTTELEQLACGPTQVQGSGARQLVSDLNWNDIETLLRQINSVEAQAKKLRAFHYRLPTPVEWERAGRGADGRRFPWGNFFDLSLAQNYMSSIDENWRHNPMEWPAEDHSPFGIRDMTGSLQEPCKPADMAGALGFSRFQLRGGSMHSRTEPEQTLLSRTFQAADERRFTTGLRLVRVALPPVETSPWARFEDTFDALSGFLAPGATGWRVQTGTGQNLERAERVEIADGNLLLHGYADDFSPFVLAWHPVCVPRDSLVLTAKLSFESEHPEHPSPRRAGVSLLIGDRAIWGREGQHLALRLQRGYIWLTWGGAATRVDLPSGSANFTVTLRVDGRRASAWVNSGGADHSAPTVTCTLPDDATAAPIRYVGIEAGNFTAVHVAVEYVTIEPAH